MVPLTSSPSAIFTRIGVAFSIRRLRYLISSNVCSGAREPLVGGGVRGLLTFFLLPVGRYVDAVFRISANTTLNLSIITVTRRDPQIRPLHFDLQLVKALLGERDVLRVEADQVLRAELMDDVGEYFVELGAGGGKEDPAASALADELQRVLAAGVASDGVSDRHHD